MVAALGAAEGARGAQDAGPLACSEGLNKRTTRGVVLRQACGAFMAAAQRAAPLAVPRPVRVGAAAPPAAVQPVVRGGRCPRGESSRTVASNILPFWLPGMLPPSQHQSFGRVWRRAGPRQWRARVLVGRSGDPDQRDQLACVNCQRPVFGSVGPVGQQACTRLLTCTGTRAA
jgi:hypothetical protein